MPRGSKPDDNTRHNKSTGAVHPLSHSQLEILALESFYQGTGGRPESDGAVATTWTRQAGWDKVLAVATALKNGGVPIPKTTTMQSFFTSVYGVKWERNHVVAIDLSENGLTGKFPAEITQLRFLTTLKLRNNPNLSGMLPQDIYSMPHLKYCYVDGTKVQNALPLNIAHSFQITRVKTATGKPSGTAISTVRFCTGDERTSNLTHWTADMTDTEMYMVHSALKMLHESANHQLGREQITRTASNATGPERAAAAIKLQRIYRARIERAKFRTFLHSLVEMKIDPATGYTYYVHARTGEATWEKPKFLGTSTDSHYAEANIDTSKNNAADAWKPYDDGNGNTVSYLRCVLDSSRTSR